LLLGGKGKIYTNFVFKEIPALLGVDSCGDTFSFSGRWDWVNSNEVMLENANVLLRSKN